MLITLNSVASIVVDEKQQQQKEKLMRIGPVTKTNDKCVDLVNQKKEKGEMCVSWHWRDEQNLDAGCFAKIDVDCMRCKQRLMHNDVPSCVVFDSYEKLEDVCVFSECENTDTFGFSALLSYIESYQPRPDWFEQIWNEREYEDFDPYDEFDDSHKHYAELHRYYEHP